MEHLLNKVPSIWCYCLGPIFSTVTIFVTRDYRSITPGCVTHMIISITIPAMCAEKLFKIDAPIKRIFLFYLYELQVYVSSMSFMMSNRVKQNSVVTVSYWLRSVGFGFGFELKTEISVRFSDPEWVASATIKRQRHTASVVRTAVVATTDSDPQFFSVDVDGPRIKASFSAYKVNLLRSGRVYPDEKQTMQLQARAACARACTSAVHVISAAGVRKSSVV